jgi:D-alanyl-lipoteichoic acid acyltransferase DltB (MBOAT superfamily)
MSFTSYSFLVFFLCVLALYWLVKDKRWQNIILLIASYVFYGWVHPWYAIMLGASTLVDHGIAHALVRSQRKNLLLAASLILNLGVLFFFKYYNFFVNDIVKLFSGMGFQTNLHFVQIILPVGLSFYTLKKIGYIIDVSKGVLKPTIDLVSFSLFVAFFPQITAGPIDRPQKLIPQFESPRTWQRNYFFSAWPLLVMGMFKKLVIANSIGPIVDRIFHLEEPTLLLAITGALGFTLQILADFSAYTDLSRGIAFLLGFDTCENFKSPYLSLTPTEFWNRWHITLSFWLRDYIFFPLRRALLRRKAQLPTWLIQAVPPLVTMLISGIWHGAGWTYVIWGCMYGVLIVVYQAIGMGGGWKPSSKIKTLFAWLVMFSFIVFGWLLFGAPSLKWVAGIFSNPLIGSMEYQAVALLGLSMALLYTIPLIIKMLIDRYISQDSLIHALYYAVATIIMLFYVNSSSPDFIYFQF